MALSHLVVKSGHGMRVMCEVTHPLLGIGVRVLSMHASCRLRIASGVASSNGRKE
jgi:hypothetical protein